MNLTLRPIDKENWKECARLEVNPEQREYVASNPFSLAQAAYEPDHALWGIYDGERMVGFSMTSIDREQSPVHHWISRFMIDRREQGKGYGKAAFRLVADSLLSAYGCKELRLSVHPANANAIHVYEQYGFRATGELLEGEQVMRFQV